MSAGILRVLLIAWRAVHAAPLHSPPRQCLLGLLLQDARFSDTLFLSRMTGPREVPPTNSTARGLAFYALAADNATLRYWVWVREIVNVTMAHIHLGGPNTIGPIVAWLYPAAPPARLIPGSTTGLLATGAITSANLVGPLVNSTLAELVSAMVSGTAYTNAHTTLHPGGEIRDQVRLI